MNNHKGDNMKDSRTPIQHGEAMLVPVSVMPKGETRKVTSEIVAHSETGHHHVVESATKFEVTGNVDKEDLYLRLFEPAKLVHKKTTQKHKTLDVAPGVWRVLWKTEYNPWSGLLSRVKD
jgi:hypothetical protein